MECTITLANESTSNASFTWQADSDPPGAAFDRSSGSIAPGKSQTVHVVADLGCPVTFHFRDRRHVAEQQMVMNSNCLPGSS
ncbi:hypothetical protein [Kitasatospora cinereorecta]|uniref:Ig-like domain-containing protein n=1 Tax=Kitasatospora cinereorecta TaxID=285560 RepID=A0ABW0VMX9_9ACTN